jgi:hypothetical protein
LISWEPQLYLRLLPFLKRWIFGLSVFDDFGLRVITFLTPEGSSVVIWFIRFNANKPHQGATVGASWLAENQSRWVKGLEIKH